MDKPAHQVIIAVPDEGPPQLQLVGVTLPGALKLLGLFVVELAGKLRVTPAP